MAAHKDLTGTDLHEPKGAASAASGTVYTANGLGSGAWTAVKASYVPVSVRFTDVSTASTQYAVCPVAGTIVGIYLCTEVAITVADAHMTFAIAGTSIDSSAITIAFTGAAAGDEYDSTPTGHNVVVAGSVVGITSDGGSTTTSDAHIVLLVQT